VSAALVAGMVFFSGFRKRFNATVESSPSGAEIFVDGVSMGITPKIVELKVDTKIKDYFLIEFRKDGYDREEYLLDTNGGKIVKNVKVFQNLHALTSTKQYNFVTTPADVAVRAEGRNLGMAPVHGVSLTFRRSNKNTAWEPIVIDFSKPDYQSESIVLTEEQSAAPPVTLSRLRIEKNVRLLAKNALGDNLAAEIELNGEKLEGKTTPANVPLVFQRPSKNEPWPEFEFSVSVATIYNAKTVVVNRETNNDIITLTLDPVTEIEVLKAFPEVVRTGTGFVYRVTEVPVWGKIQTGESLSQDLRRITSYPRRDQNPSAQFKCVNSYTLSRDGISVYYSVTEKNSTGEYISSIYQKDSKVEGGRFTDVFPGKRHLHTGVVTALQGRRVLLFQSNLDDPEKPDLFSLELEGAGALGRYTQITSGNRFNYGAALWNSDREVYFLTLERNFAVAEPYISSIRLNGTARTQFQESALAVHTMGETVYYVASDRSTQKKQVYWINLTKGGKGRLVAWDGANCFDPDVSPDGSKILFVSDKGTDENGRAQNDLYVMNADGTGGAPRRLTDNGSDDILPRWAPQEEGIVYFLSNRGGAYNLWRMQIQ